ncbi:hypothetical protein ACSMFR_06325 [Listeria aquatica]|uniref:hypothetical protein n=1 Tax=Listeria aquatica TaxID=1494960 RepID=UPI003F6F1D9F
MNDKQRVEYANWEYSNLEQGDPITIKGKGEVGKVSQVINKKATGEQSYIITNTEKSVSSNASLAEREKVTEVTILYRGSTGIDQWKKEPLDVWKDWLENDIPSATQILTHTGGRVVAPQLKSAANTLKNSLKMYPNAKHYVYAHSLGSMTAQYALSDINEKDASRIGGAYLYEGPNAYSLLTPEQKKMAEALRGKIYNYVDFKDPVTIGYGAYKENVGQLIAVDSKDINDIGKQHMWGGYQYDKEGNVLTDAKGYAALAKNNTREKLDGLEDLKKIFAKSGGNLSGSEKIFLDAAEALALTQGMKMTIQYDMNELQKTYKKAIDNADDLWRDTLKDARTIGTSLSESERLDALASGGATEASIRTKPKAKYQKKLTKLTAIQKEYDELTNNIKHAIAEQLQNDQELAQQIGSA